MILQALAYIHSADVIHRDLKPDNVLLNAACEAKVSVKSGFLLSVTDKDYQLTERLVIMNCRSLILAWRDPCTAALMLVIFPMRRAWGRQLYFPCRLIKAAPNFFFYHRSKQDADDPTMTEYVATRWYRAPEMLLGTNHHSKAVDVWSLGCVLGQMLRGELDNQAMKTVGCDLNIFFFRCRALSHSHKDNHCSWAEARSIKLI